MDINYVTYLTSRPVGWGGDQSINHSALCCVPLGSETRISESEVGGARRVRSLPLGNMTFLTSMERYFLLGNS